MGRRAVIHIGMDKTGSSSIQNSLFKADVPNVNYIHLGAANPSHKLSLIFEPDFEAQAKHVASVTNGRVFELEDKGRMTKALQRRLKTAPDDRTTVLSAENIPGFSVPAMSALKKMIESHFDEVRVIGYVRPPVSYMQSRFQHGIRTGRKREFNVGVGYRGRLRNIDDVFGPENIELIKFDRALLKDGDVVKDFVHRVGGEIADDQIVNTNESMSLEAMAVLFVTAVQGKRCTVRRNRILLDHAFKDLGSRKLKFGAEFVEPILEQRRGDIDWVERRLGVPFWDAPADGPDTMSDRESFIELGLAQDQFVLSKLEAQLKKPSATDAHREKGAQIMSMTDPADRLASAVELLADLFQIVFRARRAKNVPKA